jgi:hypothetical protein
MTRLGATLLAIAAVTSGAARADEPTTMTIGSRPPPRPPSWYGRDLLIADGLGLLLAATCGATIPEGGHPIARRCIAPLMIGGPAVHLSHDRLDRAALSLGFRIALPLAGGLIGSRFPCKDADGRPCFIGYEFAGALVGAAAAMVVDLAIAFEPSGPPPRRAVSLAPSLAPIPGGFAIGLGGWF